MNTTKIAGALLDNLTDEFSAEKSTRIQPAGEIRTLDDWELALAAGGEDSPIWN